MSNPKLRSSKLVLPAEMYARRKRIPEGWQSVIGKADYSILISGRTGCLHKDTCIITGTGLMKLQDCPDSFHALSYNFATQQTELKQAFKIHSGVKQLYQLTCKHGEIIVCSKDHTFFSPIDVEPCQDHDSFTKYINRPGLFQNNIQNKTEEYEEVQISRLHPGKTILRKVGDDMLVRTRIMSITDWGEAETYDLKVADNHNFFLSNGILTHNSGKDALTIFIMNLDLMYNRTPIVLDIKMEYAHNIFCQNDVILANLLLKNNLVGRGHRVILWIPYIQGMHTNYHFTELLRYHHPNLEIRPFRIRVSDFASEDSYNLSLQKTHLQSAAVDKSKLTAQSKQINDIKEEIARRMGFDDRDKWEEGCGWEYINFNEMTTNKKINDICTFFLSKNNIIATSYAIAITNDLITIGKGIERVRNDDEIFTVTFPEVEVILPKGVKALDSSVDTLRFNLKTSLKLMRQFKGWYRMNLQNLSVLDPDMVSQTMPFAGRTWNYKDINILGMFGLTKQERILISQSKVGTFHDVINKQSFSAVPFSHKARAGEYMLKMLREYNRDPSVYLFETESCFLSEIIDWPMIFTEGKALTVQEYNRRVKAWIAAQPRRSVKPITESLPDEREEISTSQIANRIKALRGRKDDEVVVG